MIHPHRSSDGVYFFHSTGVQNSSIFLPILPPIISSETQAIWDSVLVGFHSGVTTDFIKGAAIVHHTFVSVLNCLFLHISLTISHNHLVATVGVFAMLDCLAVLAISAKETPGLAGAGASCAGAVVFPICQSGFNDFDSEAFF